jgi:hypothetical protein
MSPFLVNGSTVISSVTRVREGNFFSSDMTGSYRSALSAPDRTVLASERSNRIVLATITSRTTIMTATLTTSWPLSARSLWTKLSTLKCATVHTSHKVTHVALPNPDRSNRVAVAKRFSQVRFRPCKLNYFHQCGVPALSSGEGKSPFVCPDPRFFCGAGSYDCPWTVQGKG